MSLKKRPGFKLRRIEYGPRRLRYASGILALMQIIFCPTALAWKPNTHIFLAEQVLNDIIGDGKVTIHRVQYGTGRELEAIGEYSVSPDILNAIRSHPEQFRAGVLGPDAYPDILTGQQAIHPDNSRPSGTDSWLQYLWREASSGPSSSSAAKAFVLGFLTHSAGDMYGHTLVNYYTGGPFELGENAVKHIVLEGYIGKRTPVPESTVSGTITEGNISIDGVNDFIYDSMVDARPGSTLAQSLLVGPGSDLSVPKIYSVLKAGLQDNVRSYYDAKRRFDQRYDNKLNEKESYENCKWWDAACHTRNTGRFFRNRGREIEAGIIQGEKLVYVTTNSPLVTYKEAWINDITRGLRRWPSVSHSLAKNLIFSSGGTNMKEAKDIISEFATMPNGGLLSMMGLPDAFLWAHLFADRIAEAILPDALLKPYKQMKRDLFNYLIKESTGMDIDDYKAYFQNPELYFDKVLDSGSRGAHTNLTSFNAEMLKIADTGYNSPAQRYDYRSVPATYNTVVMTKLLLLDSSEVNRLLADLDSNRRFGGVNAMLGFIRTLDGDNQWRANPGNPGLMILADDCGAYRQVFMRQVGEKGGCVPVLNREEATRQLVSLFNDIIGRDPSQAEIDWGISELENGSTIERIRRTIAHKTETSEAITTLYTQIVRRLPRQEEMADWQNRLSINLTLKQVRQLIANSDEVKGLLSNMAKDLLDRSFSDAELSAYQSRLSASTKLDLIQQEIANSDEALTKIRYFYVNIVGRFPKSDEVIQTQTRFSKDYTLKLLRKDLANSQDAKRAIARLHKIVFNRLPTSLEVDSWQVRLQDDSILLDVRKYLANSDETKANINRIYKRLLNRPPLESELTMWTSRLSTDASLTDVEREIKAKHFLRKQYRVQRGDNLTYIAKMFYGDGNPVLRERHSSHHYYYRSIYNINRRFLSDPDLIFPGQLLTVPLTSTPLTYKVRRGDTLSYISKLYYGNPHGYVRILRANPILASSPDFLRLGQVLVIPYD
jgi:hypothetical protein